LTLFREAAWTLLLNRESCAAATAKDVITSKRTLQALLTSCAMVTL
jgi:hypothetical protein